jgi:hypothetical protein
MAGSRTHFKIRTANSGKDSNRVRDNSKWYKSVYDKLHNLAVTTSYDLNKKILGNFVLQSGQQVTYPNGQYTYLGVVVLMDYVMKIGFLIPSFRCFCYFITYQNENKTGKENGF